MEKKVQYKETNILCTKLWVSVSESIPCKV